MEANQVITEDLNDLGTSWSFRKNSRGINVLVHEYSRPST